MPCIAAGFDAFLPKPVERSEQIEAVRRLSSVDWVFASPDDAVASAGELALGEGEIAFDPELADAWEALGKYPALNEVKGLGETRDLTDRSSDKE